MPKTLVIPLELNSDGTFAVTEDPAEVVRLRILDLLVTSKWERVHRSSHGCDLEGFLFTNVVDHVLALKAEEIRQTLNAALSYGEVVQVLMTPMPSQGESSVQVAVLFRVYAGGDIEQMSQTFTGLAEEGNPL